MKTALLNQCLSTAFKYLTKHPQYDHYLHYSYIIQENKLIEWGTNHDGTPPVHFGYNKKSCAAKLHSELVAYKKGRGLIDKSLPFEIINIRFNRRGDIKISAPCFVCQEWLKSVGCSAVWFTTDGGKFARMRL